ncbi:MAG: RND family efflux transporter MFP subunit [Paraglaciecola sp.]|jgi:RND family efflux transporter MFP subunit
MRQRLLIKAGVPILIIALAIGVSALMVSMKKVPEQKPVENKAFLVDATTIKTQDLNFIVKSQGIVAPKIQTILSAQVTGRIVNVSESFIEGGMFRKGDLLIQIEQFDYITDLKLWEAELAKANAALLEEQARGDVAAKEWQTFNRGTAPELGLRKPQLAKELANVRATQAQLERAQRNLQRTTIRAPYDGMVKDKQANIGQFVSLGGTLGTVYSTDVAEVRMPLSDNDLAYLELPSAQGVDAQVTLHASIAGKLVSWQGILTRNEGVFDQQSRVIYGVAEIADPYLRTKRPSGDALKFGRFVQADIIGSRALGLVVLSRDVMRLDGTVMVVNDQRTLEIRDVQVQRADEKHVYISSGLKDGELVITSVVPNPVDGMQLRLLSDLPATPEQDTQTATKTAIASAEL